MPLLKEHIRQAAKLARLKLTSTEIGKLALQLPSVFAYFDQIADIPTDSVPLYRGAVSAKNSLREDGISPSLSAEQALANAPEADRGFFLVPKVVDR